MAHDVQAAWASAELAHMFGLNPAQCFAAPPGPVSAFAGRESKSVWPHADGVVAIEGPSISGRIRKVAVEFKRPNEGIHGVLTALGQAHAYLHKGYSGSAIVVPSDYDTLKAAAGYVRDVLQTCSATKRVGVYGYAAPELGSPTPFRGRLTVVRPLEVDVSPPSAEAVRYTSSETQWAHVREGSTTPDGFYRFLQTTKLVTAGIRLARFEDLPRELRAAAASSPHGPEKFLSNSVGDEPRDVAWREFWFRFVLTAEVAVPWNKVAGRYQVVSWPTGIRKADGSGYSVFFSGRSDSVKDKLVRELNAGSLSEDEAWLEFATNIRKRAHSFREDVDSGLEHLGFVDASGRISEAGFRFVDACERTDDPNSGLARGRFASALLRHGQFAAFLHYLHFVSERSFSVDPDAFATAGKFDQVAYLEHLEQVFVDELRVMRTVSKRGGAARRPFQGELAQLRQLGMVSGFRRGVGLVVNWPAVHQYLEIDDS